MKMKLNKNLKIILIILILNLITYTTSKLLNSLLYKKSHKSQRRGPDDGFTEQDKKDIIDTHNKLRNEIALQTNKIGPKLPFATNMIQTYYSTDVHDKAQKWADGQKFMHSTSKYRKQPNFPCGENLYMSMVSGMQPKKDWKKAVNEWYSEIKNMGGKSVDSFASGGPVTGHFTQVIWAHSYIIGCGFKKYNKGGWITSLYVCQYGPVGNIMGMKIYKSSPSKGCKCEFGMTCGNDQWPGLCCAKGKCKGVYDWAGKPYEGTVPKNLVMRR